MNMRNTMFKKLIFTGLFLSLTSLAFAQSEKMEKKLEKATFGAGCFWCVEAVYELVEGVEYVESGYSGGHVEDPSYKQVVRGNTGHVEVARVHYDPSVISYEQLLEIHWHSHDPTTLNRQGNDVGEHYRSVIFFHNEEQKRIADSSSEKKAKRKVPKPEEISLNDWRLQKATTSLVSNSTLTIKETKNPTQPNPKDIVS